MLIVVYFEAIPVVLLHFIIWRELWGYMEYRDRIWVIAPYKASTLYACSDCYIKFLVKNLSLLESKIKFTITISKIITLRLQPQPAWCLFNFLNLYFNS